MHLIRHELQRDQPQNRPSSTGQITKCEPLGHRNSAEHTRLPRKLEHNTNNWLRNYMYLRVTPKGKKPGFRASLATFVTSTFWHGFYPGYYLSFILAAFLQTAAKSKPPDPFFFLQNPPYQSYPADIRRHIRPFFLTPDGQRPTPYKRYYDILSYLTTQAAFSFTTAPFILLTLPDSLRIWSRVYFYVVLGVIFVTVFFASPAKPWLVRRLETRNRAVLKTLVAADQRAPLTGLPEDPARDVDEAMQEIKDEVELRRRKGVIASMPSGEEMRVQVEEKLGKTL